MLGEELRVGLEFLGELEPEEGFLKEPPPLRPPLLLAINCSFILL